MSELGELASGIYSSEFDSDSTAANYASISGWLSENIGLLNTLIHTSYVGDSPGLNQEEQAILKQLFMHSFYGKQARNVVRGIVATSNAGDNILSVSDGDNKIEFVNRNEVGKVYRGMATDAKTVLDQLVAKYNIYGAKPLQVGGYEATSLSYINNGEFGVESVTHGQELLDAAVDQLEAEGLQFAWDGGVDGDAPTDGDILDGGADND